MTALLDELGDMAQLDAGAPLHLHRQAVDLVALSRQAVHELQLTSPQHDLRVMASVPALVGQWDRRRLERVLTNLLMNAVKYSPDGGAITLTLQPEGGGSAPWVQVVIEDQGLGIPAADLPHIFEPYHRGQNVRGRIGGTGLGLASVRHIVEQHGGTLAVVSTEGGGSRFTVTLPITPPAGE
jgi:signal transduction histidine kinase